MAINKVIYGGNTLIDLTADTVDSSHLLVGVNCHDKSGSIIEGACTFDADTQDATAAQAEILDKKTAYARGAKLTGTMVNNGGVNATITDKNTPYTIPIGYHDGSGKVSVSSATLLAGNIKSGIQILGVTGTYTGASISAQSKTVSASTSQDVTVQPDAGYDYLSSVKVNKISYVSANNSAGGQTITIG